MKKVDKSLEKDEFDCKMKKLENERKALTKAVKSLSGKKAQVTSKIKLIKTIGSSWMIRFTHLTKS